MCCLKTVTPYSDFFLLFFFSVAEYFDFFIKSIPIIGGLGASQGLEDLSPLYSEGEGWGRGQRRDQLGQGSSTALGLEAGQQGWLTLGKFCIR